MQDSTIPTVRNMTQAITAHVSELLNEYTQKRDLLSLIRFELEILHLIKNPELKNLPVFTSIDNVCELVDDFNEWIESAGIHDMIKHSRVTLTTSIFLGYKGAEQEGKLGKDFNLTFQIICESTKITVGLEKLIDDFVDIPLGIDVDDDDDDDIFLIYSIRRFKTWSIYFRDNFPNFYSINLSDVDVNVTSKTLTKKFHLLDQCVDKYESQIIKLAANLKKLTTSLSGHNVTFKLRLYFELKEWVRTPILDRPHQIFCEINKFHAFLEQSILSLRGYLASVDRKRFLLDKNNKYDARKLAVIDNNVLLINSKIDELQNCLEMKSREYFLSSHIKYLQTTLNPRFQFDLNDADILSSIDVNQEPRLNIVSLQYILMVRDIKLLREDLHPYTSLADLNLLQATMKICNSVNREIALHSSDISKRSILKYLQSFIRHVTTLIPPYEMIQQHSSLPGCGKSLFQSIYKTDDSSNSVGRNMLNLSRLNAGQCTFSVFSIYCPDDEGNTLLHIASTYDPYYHFVTYYPLRHCFNKFSDLSPFHESSISLPYLHSMRSTLDIPGICYVRAVDYRNNKGCTPFHCAAYSGFFYAVQLLLSLGVDINAQTYRGSTPIHLLLKSTHAVKFEGWQRVAVEKGLKETFSFLRMQDNIDLTLVDSSGKTPLETAREKRLNAFAEAIDYDINFELAARRKNYAKVREYISDHPDVNDQLDKHGYPPIYLALERGGNILFDLLYENDPSIIYYKHPGNDEEGSPEKSLFLTACERAFSIASDLCARDFIKLLLERLSIAEAKLCIVESGYSEELQCLFNINPNNIQPYLGNDPLPNTFSPTHDTVVKSDFEDLIHSPFVSALNAVQVHSDLYGSPPVKKVDKCLTNLIRINQQNKREIETLKIKFEELRRQNTNHMSPQHQALDDEVSNLSPNQIKFYKKLSKKLECAFLGGMVLSSAMVQRANYTSGDYATQGARTFGYFLLSAAQSISWVPEPISQITSLVLRLIGGIAIGISTLADNLDSVTPENWEGIFNTEEDKIKRLVSIVPSMSTIPYISAVIAFKVLKIYSYQIDKLTFSAIEKFAEEAKNRIVLIGKASTEQLKAYLGEDDRLEMSPAHFTMIVELLIAHPSMSVNSSKRPLQTINQIDHNWSLSGVFSYGGVRISLDNGSQFYYKNKNVDMAQQDKYGYRNSSDTRIIQIFKLTQSRVLTQNERYKHAFNPCLLFKSVKPTRQVIKVSLEQKNGLF